MPTPFAQPPRRDNNGLYRPTRTRGLRQPGKYSPFWDICVYHWYQTVTTTDNSSTPTATWNNNTNPP